LGIAPLVPLAAELLFDDSEEGAAVVPPVAEAADAVAEAVAVAGIATAKIATINVGIRAFARTATSFVGLRG
jgi:hypothetical protein